MPGVRHKIHSYYETNPKKLKILCRKLFEGGKPTGAAWSILGDDREETVFECGSTVTALKMKFSKQEFVNLCSVLDAWYKSQNLFGGRECVMIFPMPNASHKIYFAPGADEPMNYPLDKIDTHYRVPRYQFESMKSERLGSATCAFLTNGKRWSNTLGHPVGESFHWGSGEILWDRSNLLWLFNYRLRDEQFQRLWNYSLNTHNLGLERRSISGLEIDRQDAAFLLAVQRARSRRNHHA